MTNTASLNSAADAVVRAIEVATLPVTEFVNFIAARGYPEEIYDARHDIRPVTENVVRGTFTFIASAVTAVTETDFNFFDLIEGKVYDNSDAAARAPFANDNADTQRQVA